MNLEELTNLSGISGEETDVRNFILEKMNPKEVECSIDALGNLICKKFSDPKSSSNKRVMLLAHMDEVGFMVCGITRDGEIKITQVGGLDERILPGKYVRIGKNKIPGVLFAKEKPSKNTPEILIDIGASDFWDARAVINAGDAVLFDSTYEKLGTASIKAKAVDDRVGCSVLMDILNAPLKSDAEIYGCFVVQEEVGLRGSGAVTHRIKPDLALVLEGTTCSDLPNMDPWDYSTVLGEGPAISLMDRSTYYDRELVHKIIGIAKNKNIPIQVKNTFTGGNDSARVQRSNLGVPVAVISLPVRYIHSPSSIMNLQDYENTERLLEALLENIEELIPS